MQAETS
jgi:hypothetical protein